MTIGSNNKFPKVIITEGSAPSNADAGDQKLYIDSADHILKRKDSSGTVTAIEGVGTGTGLVFDITFVIDGGGSAITTGIKGDLIVDFACTLTAWTLLADQSGAIKIDVWRDVYGSFPPTDADSLTNAHEPEIAASGVSAQDTDISDWTDVTLDAGDILRFNVDSCASIARATLAIKATRS